MGFLESLYFDIGKKIKNWAIWMAIIEAIGSVITGIVFLCVYGIEDGWWGLIISVCGPVVAYVNTWLLYGFGELIDKACDIAENTNIISIPAREEYEKNKQEEEKTRKEAIEEAAKKRQEAIERARQEAKANPNVGSFTVVDEKTIVCHSCNFVQSINRKTYWCSNCGVKFEEKEI